MEQALQTQLTTGQELMNRIEMVMKDDSLQPRHKKAMVEEITELYNPMLVAGMIRAAVTVPYEQAPTYEDLIVRLYPHINLREARVEKGYMIKLAIKKLREAGIMVESTWRPGTGYRICIPTKKDRLYMIGKRIWPIALGIQKWEERLKLDDISQDEIEMFKKLAISSM